LKGSEYIKKETQGEEVKITEEYKQKIGKIKELKKNFNDLSRQLISQSESYISGGPSKILGFDGVDTEIGLLDYDKQFTEVIKPEIEK
jgi:predicted nuclease with TOPRIM domain